MLKRIGSEHFQSKVEACKHELTDEKLCLNRLKGCCANCSDRLNPDTGGDFAAQGLIAAFHFIPTTGRHTVAIAIHLLADYF